jgi:hypothetical protein
MAHILISPLNWGLGHASRDVPVIRELLRNRHVVTIAAGGNALELLRREFPTCTFIDFPDYPLADNRGKFFFPRFTAHVPALVKALSEERRNLYKILKETSYDLIISDSRPGVYSDTTPSIQISHQVHQSFPFIVWPIELIALYVNGRGFKKFDSVIIPDNPPGPLSLAGKLSRTTGTGTRKLAYYSGILASIPKVSSRKEIDYLFLISGMEPQRTALEKIVLPRVKDLPGRKAVLLGRPSDNRVWKPDDDTTVYNYVSYQEKAELMSGSDFIICRSGYTTMMDLAEIRLKKGLFIPTPGQWEQEYLSAYYRRKSWFMSTGQAGLHLSRDVERARGYRGFPAMAGTEENVRKLYREHLIRYLE